SGRPLNFTVRAHVKAVTVGNLVRVLFLVAFAAMLVTRQYYARHMPPQPSEDRVIAVSVNYGKTVYVTSNERAGLYATYIWCAVMLVVLVVRSNNRWRGP